MKEEVGGESLDRSDPRIEIVTGTLRSEDLRSLELELRLLRCLAWEEIQSPVVEQDRGPKVLELRSVSRSISGSPL